MPSRHRTHTDEQSEERALWPTRSSFFGNSLLCGNDPSKNARDRRTARWTSLVSAMTTVVVAAVGDQTQNGEEDVGGQIFWMRVA